MDDKQIVVIQKRVLRLVDAYLANHNQGELWGAKGGMMTVAELREHIKGALKLRSGLTKRALDGAKVPQKSKRSTGSPRK